MIGKSFEQCGIKFPRGSKQTGNVKTLCPQCSHTRRNRPDEPCLSVAFDRADTRSGKLCHLFNCKHCGWKGAVFPDGIPEGDDADRVEFDTKTEEYKKPTIDINSAKYKLNKQTIDWFAARGITKEVLIKFNIRSCEWLFEKERGYEPAIMFPFFKNGELINVQFRNFGDKKEKRYKSLTGCQYIYYNYDAAVLDGFVSTDILIVCEGPIDAMALRMAGYPFVWSLPNGSPFEEEGKPEIVNPKLKFHDDPDAQEVFKRVRKVVFFGDNDHPGRKIVKEIATRVGVEKCYRVVHPPEAKDPNEVLTKYGVNKLIEVVERAERFPVEGVIRISQLRSEVKTIYHNGLDTGLSTGFPNLDRHFRVGQGKVIVVTGVPGSGKSRFMANLGNNLSKLHGIAWSFFAPENRPFGTYATKMAQILTGKRFGSPGDTDRMSEKELDDALDWLDQYFTFNSPNERSLAKILDIWRIQLGAEGVRYGVIDPFNYVYRPEGKVDEGQFVLRFMTELSDFCARNNFTAFVVAHPTKVHLISDKKDEERDGEYPIIQPYNISGSAHWNNCADFILSIWRSVKDISRPVELHILKAKQEELGTSNQLAEFHYDVKTGIYTPYGSESSDEEEEVPFNRLAKRKGRTAGI